jgi:hypothetical protein
MTISNQEFIGTIFRDLLPDEYCWSALFTCSPQNAKGTEWEGNRTYPNQIQDTPFGNSYFCVSALKPNAGQSRRRKDNFSRLMCVVLDDPQSCDLAPSWKIETSQDNFQIGFILSDPIEDIATSDRLHQALANESFIKVDRSGNNSVRYVRMPTGLNTKYQPNFQCVMRVWNPDLHYSVNELCEALGLKLIPSAIDHSSPYEPSGERLEDSEYIRQIMSGESLHDPLNVLSARMHYRGMATHNIIEHLQGVMLAVKEDSDRWQSRFDDIPRSVKGAVEKFKSENNQSPLEPKDLLPEYQYSCELMKPVEFVIDGFISNRLTLIAGAPGVGKSTALVSMAAVAAGIMKPEGLSAELNRKVFYVTEDAEQIERILYGMRAQRLTELSQGQIQESFKIIHARRRSAQEIAQMISLARSIGVTEHSSGFAIEPLIVLDTANATLDLDNENDNSEAGKAIAAIKESLGSAALWIVGHTAKAIKRAELASLSFRGAGAFEGDCHATCYLFSDEAAGSDVRFLALGKHRYVSSYQEVQINTVLGKVQVATKWGTSQDCWYCVGIPNRSSAQKREELKQASKDNALLAVSLKTKKRIVKAVIEATQGDEPINRSALRQIIGIRVTTVNKLIAELISEGWLEETKTEGKKGNDLIALKELSDQDFEVSSGTIGNKCVQDSINLLLEKA